MTVAAEVILSSRSIETGKRIMSVEICYPRMIHSEFMTHRVMGRNAASSRAIPMKRMHMMILDDPALPEKFTMNQAGMQGYEDAPPEVVSKALRIIGEHRRNSIDCAEQLAELGLHKQVFNRYTEAHQHIRVLVTSTEWINFFNLRTDKAAEPTMRVLASHIYEASKGCLTRELQRGDWHLPYLQRHEEEELLRGPASDEFDIMPGVFPPHAGKRSRGRALTIAVSATRCARLSYNNFTGTRAAWEEDVTLFQKLMGAQPLHASPTEHQATPDWQDLYGNWANPRLHGNLVGWKQSRKFVPEESGPIDHHFDY